MTANRKLGWAIGLAILAIATFVAWILVHFLPGHGWRWMLGGCTLMGGGGAAFLCGWLIATKLPDARRARIAVTSIFAAVFLVPVLSMFTIGRVTGSAFGFTMYGLIPIPALDITVGPNGGLWFREKTHHVGLDEIEPLVGEDTEVVIVGTGWHNAVKVDDAVRDLEGYDVRILPTPKAFELFNRLVSAGRRVVMLAHSTC